MELISKDGRFEASLEVVARDRRERFFEFTVYDDGGNPITWTLRVGRVQVGAWWLPKMRRDNPS